MLSSSFKLLLTKKSLASCHPQYLITCSKHWLSNQSLSSTEWAMGRISMYVSGFECALRNGGGTPFAPSAQEHRRSNLCAFSVLFNPARPSRPRRLFFSQSRGRRRRLAPCRVCLPAWSPSRPWHLRCGRTPRRQSRATHLGVGWRTNTKLVLILEAGGFFPARRRNDFFRGGHLPFLLGGGGRG